MPAPQVDAENCVAHNGAVIPVPGRDIFVQAWYQGGISIIDFTDSTKPVEIAYFDRGPVHEEKLVLGGYWSTYWYKGKIYGTEIARGLDVFSLLPSDYLTENEIAAAMLADQGERFNPQQQFRVSWPDNAIIARAYMDQLARTDALPGAMVTELNSILNRATLKLEAGTPDKSLAKELKALVTTLKDGEPASEKRRLALGKTLAGMADRLK